MHLDFEVTIFTPVCSPTVSSDPVFNSFFRNSPSDNSYFVIYKINYGFLRVNSSGIVFELVSYENSTRNRSSSIYFSFHFSSSFYFSILVNIMKREFFDWFTAWVWHSLIVWRRSETVHANLHRRTREFCRIFSNVILTSFFRNTVSVSVLVNSHWVTSFTRSSCIAVDDNLRRN